MVYQDLVSQHLKLLVLEKSSELSNRYGIRKCGYVNNSKCPNKSTRGKQSINKTHVKLYKLVSSCSFIIISHRRVNAYLTSQISSQLAREKRCEKGSSKALPLSVTS